MSDLIEFFNTNAGSVSAIAAIVTAWLTYSIHKSTRTQAEVATALKAIEAGRDSIEDPRVFIWFNGYSSFDGTASFVMQNSGRRSMFLKSLRLSSPGMDVAYFDLETNREKKEGEISGGELRDLVITPDRVERIFFKFKNGSGQAFEIIAQLYTGNPVRLMIDPSTFAGYELRAIRSSELFASIK